jgi:hypothetical protein
MPTTRPRHLITETDDLAAALDIAAAQWPGVSRPQLLVKLAITAAEPLAAEAVRQRRLAAHERIAGGEFAGLYPPDYLERLREDWPE